MKSAEGPPKFSTIASASLSIMLFLCLLMTIAAIFEITVPSSENLAYQYLNRVRQGNLESVKGLAGDNQYCQQGLFDQAKRDFPYIGNAEMRNLSVLAKQSTGSSDTFEYVMINFEYRRPNQTSWNKGELQLNTDHTTLGFRYICIEDNGSWSDYS